MAETPGARSLQAKFETGDRVACVSAPGDLSDYVGQIGTVTGYSAGVAHVVFDGESDAHQIRASRLKHALTVPTFHSVAEAQFWLDLHTPEQDTMSMTGDSLIAHAESLVEDLPADERLDALDDLADRLTQYAKVARIDAEPDGAPCCPDPDCGPGPCTFPGYAANH